MHADIIGDLSFGEPFGSLQNEQTHVFVANLFFSVSMLPWVQLALYYGLFSVLALFAPKEIVEGRKATIAIAKDKVERRLRKTEDREDFLSYILKHNKEKELSHEEIHTNAEALLFGGSETTASLLSGLTYNLLRNQSVYEKLVKEIRGAFVEEVDINAKRVGQLKYLGAVLEESLRLYPPAPGTIARVVPEEGASIDVQLVPGGV